MVLLNSPLLAVSIDAALESLFAQRPVSDPIPVAIQELWRITILGGGIYGLLSAIGGMIATFFACYWTVQLFRSFEDGNGLRPIAEKMVVPLLMLVLLSNGGSNMGKVTLVVRDMMNNINALVSTTISTEVDIRMASEVLSRQTVVPAFLNAAMKSCAASPNPRQITGCLNGVRAFADGLVGAPLPERPATAGTISEKYRMQLEKWKEAQMAQNAKMVKDAEEIAKNNLPPANPTPPVNNTDPLANPAPTPAVKVASNPKLSVLDSSFYTNQESSNGVISTMLSFKKGFSYILEIMHLVIGLVGPIFLGFVLFPAGLRAFTSWGISFIAVGFCKICFTLISGLSSIAFIYAGPDNVDMTVVAVVLGLLAPVLSVMIAANTGLNALSSITQVTSAGNIGIGLNAFKPGDLKQ
jgi:hypothetical protein